MGQIQGHVWGGGGISIDGVETGSQFSERWRTKVETDFGVLPVAETLKPLLPVAGLERGHCYAIKGDAALSLLFALVSRASREGAWLAMVNMPDAGLMAAQEHGVALQRVLCVSAGDAARSWAAAVGALVAGIDIVAVTSPECGASDARRIAAQARAQGSIVLVVGDPGPFSVDATFTTRTLGWAFDTHASARTVSVGAVGRRVHTPRTCVVEFGSFAVTTEAGGW